MAKAYKELLSMAIPMVSTRFTQTLNTFVMMVIVAQLGHTVLAASFSISMIRIIGMLIFMSPLFAVGAVVGRQYGKQNWDAMPQIIKQGWSVALLLSIPPLLIFIFIGPLMVLCRQPEPVIPIITVYFKYLVWALPSYYITIVNQQFLSGIKRQNVVLLLSVISATLNIILNYGLVLGNLGMPKMGVAGAGISSIIIGYTNFLISSSVIIYLTNGKVFYPFIKGLKWAKSILVIGLPIGYRTASDMVALLVFTVMTGWFGQVAMGASQISSEYMMFVILPLFGLSEAATIVIGHALGSKNYLFIENIGRATLNLSIGFAIFIATTFVLFHRQLADLFIHFGETDAEEIYHLAMWLLSVQIVSMLFNAVIFAITGSLCGFYDTKYPMWLSIWTSWLISVPLSFVLAYQVHMGVVGIAIASLIAKVVSSILLLNRWKNKLAHVQTTEA